MSRTLPRTGADTGTTARVPAAAAAGATATAAAAAIAARTLAWESLR
ncbi:hypothetical protein [Nonomuraea dietziae]